MASLQNAYIHVHSSFHFKKIFSHKIYISMASFQNVYTCVQSTFYFKKNCPTTFTFEWLLFRMHTFMFNQVSISAKSFVTEVIFIWFFFCICVLRSSQSPILRKLFAAKREIFLNNKYNMKNWNSKFIKIRNYVLLLFSFECHFSIICLFMSTHFYKILCDKIYI